MSPDVRSACSGDQRCRSTGVRLYSAIIFSCLMGLAAHAFGAAKFTEMPGAHDHPLLSRYEGSILSNASSEHFAALRVPASPGTYGPGDKLAFAQSTAVEGKVSGYFYVAPKGRSALEVFRNYEAALKRGGFVPLYHCELRACDAALNKEVFANEVVRPRKWESGRSDPSGSIDRDVRFVSAKLTQNGVDAYVMVFVAEPDSTMDGSAATVVLVAEPAAAELGKVVVNSDKLRSALQDQGKISLYGIYFDTGRAEVKPESNAQLEEMARLLKADTALKVLIVGHTDNQGELEANLTLSQRRADAVVAALTGKYKVDPSKLRPRGVASLAPVASNHDDAGRARNRRVEMVEQ